ncbi:hypothetical protein BDV96DRAFT_675784 [Lophiotrema nucula]|uniref:Uncharacterized protein n=1 Tax=Lophiotrema nucula TaxID=690887 RepID=A0A6A5YIJ8_9PLEO|nr:hypothetical protein BDV96DRAFT_675784 [Lophiotrema nucula]
MPKYPGLGLALRYNEDPPTGFYPIGTHSSCSGATSDPLPVREVAMMDIMERLTDKDRWDTKVFDEKIIERWRKEALEIPDTELWSLATGGNLMNLDPLEGIMTEATFDCCIEELRKKALYHQKTGLVPTLDACASVAKSDKIVTASLHQRLRFAFEKLLRDQPPDWHPHSNETVRDLVHPSLYPLVYGRSKVLKTESVGVKGAISKWAGKGDVIDRVEWNPDPHEGRSRRIPSFDIPSDYWSNIYQWLPANLAFSNDGSNAVRFTSYINNLHPTRYSDIYRTIEELVEASLPAWDQCGTAHVDIDWDKLRRERKFRFNPEWDDEVDCKWKLLRKPKIPEPVIDDVDYSPKVRISDKFRESGLQIMVKIASIELTLDKPESAVGGWHVEGQMNEHICATALYYVDCENVTSSSLSFRMQTRDDIETDSRYSVNQDSYHWMENLFGTTLSASQSPCLQNYGVVGTSEGRLLAFPNVLSQHQVSSFRLIDPSKPGHRRFIAIWLVDPNRRIISTANVPPQQREWWSEAILGSTLASRHIAVPKIPREIMSLIKSESSKNSGTITIIAPQEGVEPKLPPELTEMIKAYLIEGSDRGLMGPEEAKNHRLKLMEERSRFVRTAEEGWKEHSYGFCEH